MNVYNVKKCHQISLHIRKSSYSNFSIEKILERSSEDEEDENADEESENFIEIKQEHTEDEPGKVDINFLGHFNS